MINDDSLQVHYNNIKRITTEYAVCSLYTVCKLRSYGLGVIIVK